MPSKVYSAAIVGLDAQIIEIETEVSYGLRSFTIVGLPDKTVQESTMERWRLLLLRYLKNSACTGSDGNQTREQNKIVLIALYGLEHNMTFRFELEVKI